MPEFDPGQEPSAWGAWEDADALRRWSFARRTPEQRLAWLQAALDLAYQSGAIKPRRPEGIGAGVTVSVGDGQPKPKHRHQLPKP